MIEVAIVAKVTAIAAIGLMGARAAARARASVRHLLLAATFGALVAVPAVMLAVPDLTLDVPVTRTAATAPLLPARPTVTAAAPALVDVRPDAPRTPAMPVTVIARAIWMAGSLIFSIPLIALAWQVRRVRRTSIPNPELTALARTLGGEAGIRRPIEVIQHEDMPAPVTFGLRRPVIVLPLDAPAWSPDDLRRAIVHELEHVGRGDWAVLVGARLVASVYWFHPLVWTAWRQLGLEAERACDDAVLLKSEGADYAEQLVSLASRLSAAATPMLGMANRSDLSARVSSLLDDGQRRGRAGLATIAAAVAAAALVVIAVAPLRAVDAGQAGSGLGPGSGAGQGAGSGAGFGAGSSRGASRAERALDAALLEAADAADLRGVNDLIAAGANVNAVFPGDGSPLIVAARSNELAIVRVLLDRGADPNLAVPGDGSPLIQAAGRGAFDIASLLIDRGADVNLVVPGDENALMNAAVRGALDVVTLLVGHGANVNERIWADYSGPDHRGEWRTALGQAAKNGHADVVAYLKSVGAVE